MPSQQHLHGYDPIMTLPRSKVKGQNYIVKLSSWLCLMTFAKHDLEPVMTSYPNPKPELSGVVITLTQLSHAEVSNIFMVMTQELMKS